MQKIVFLLVLLVVGLNICLGQIEVPLTKQTIRAQDSEYDQESIYTFDLVYKYSGKEFALKTVVDLQNDKDWVIDDTCSNCFTSKQTTHGFHCSVSCKTDSYNPPTLFLSDRIKASSTTQVSAEVTIDKHTINLFNVHDVFELKVNHNSALDRLFLDKAQAGLAFSANQLKSSRSSLNQLFRSIEDKESKKIISLFVNQEMGKLLIGHTENFFSRGELFKFNALEEDDGTLAWGVKVGPYLTLEKSPEISSIDLVDPSNTKTADLFTVYFDSNTKFIEFPLVVWNRLNKVLFSFNNCSLDAQGNSICDCNGRNSQWVPIGFTLIKNPQDPVSEQNSHSFHLHPESYLEEIHGGKLGGKCLLLIRPSGVIETTEYHFGSSFLQNYYTIYNYERKTIGLTKSHGFVPTALHIDEGVLLPFIIAGILAALLLILLLLCLLKGVKVPQEAPEQDYYKPHQHTTVSYLVRSPREIESIQQITKSVKNAVQYGSPVHARVIKSPNNVGYSQSQLYQ